MDQDGLYWCSLVIKQLTLLLDSSPSYTLAEVQSHIDCVKKRLLEAGALGPKPISPIASWKSYLTDDHSPIEYSLSIKKNACTIRFAFEPLSSLSGTPGDPVNHIAPMKWLDKNKGKNDDLSWMNTLSQHLVLDPPEHASLSPDACGLTQHVFGLDLVDKPMLKPYIFYDSLARQTSSSVSESGVQKDKILANAMEAVGLGSQWGKVATYLEHLRLHRPQHAGQTEFIGWDAVNPKSARMKVYVRFAKADLPELLSHLDLGGALDVTKQHTREIQAAATEMWHVLAGANEDGEITTDDLQGCAPRTRGVILYYELKQSDPDPIPKFYFPVRHYFSSDLEIAKRFDDFLVRKDLRKPGWYLSLVREYCDHRNLDARSGLQTMLGCAVRKGEWELSMYLSAEAYAPERWPPVAIPSQDVPSVTVPAQSSDVTTTSAQSNPDHWSIGILRYLRSFYPLYR